MPPEDADSAGVTGSAGRCFVGGTAHPTLIMPLTPSDRGGILGGLVRSRDCSAEVAQRLYRSSHLAR